MASRGEDGRLYPDPGDGYNSPQIEGILDTWAYSYYKQYVEPIELRKEDPRVAELKEEELAKWEEEKRKAAAETDKRVGPYETARRRESGAREVSAEAPSCRAVEEPVRASLIETGSRDSSSVPSEPVRARETVRFCRCGCETPSKYLKTPHKDAHASLPHVPPCTCAHEQECPGVIELSAAIPAVTPEHERSDVRSDGRFEGLALLIPKASGSCQA